MGLELSASEIVNTMDEISRERAKHSGRGARVASWLGSKIHKWKKPKNIANLVLEGTHAFIPIPLVGSTLINLEMKAVEKIRETVRDFRRDDWFVEDLESGVKFGIKDFDMAKLDRGRYKTMYNRDEYNKLQSKMEGNRDLCINAYWLAYRYRRWEYRVQKMHVLATSLRKLAKDLQQWTDQQYQLVNSHRTAHEKNLLSALEGRHPAGSCGNACLKYGDSTGAMNFQAHISKHHSPDD